MTRGLPQWGIYYKDDTYPDTYAMSWEHAMQELLKYPDEVTLMVEYMGEWVPVVYGE